MLSDQSAAILRQQLTMTEEMHKQALRQRNRCKQAFMASCLLCGGTGAAFITTGLIPLLIAAILFSSCMAFCRRNLDRVDEAISKVEQTITGCQVALMFQPDTDQLIKDCEMPKEIAILLSRMSAN